MVHVAVRLVAAVGVMVGSFSATGAVQAAGEVIVAVSPSEVAVGQPIEVLVRTFWVVDRADLSLPFESPIAPYPVPSGVWDIVYPWADYPFDVVAQHAGDPDVAVQLVRDASDSTLWRGTVSLRTSGTWTIWVRNFVREEGGAIATVTVRSGDTRPSGSSPSAPPTTKIAIDPVAAALLGVVAGAILTSVVALVWRRGGRS
jgi:hypothetical protein